MTEPEAKVHAEASFPDLIAPLSPEQFSADYWEKSFLHLRRNTPPAGLADYFSLRDLPRWTSPPRGSVVFVVVPEGDGVRFEIHETKNIGSEAVGNNFRRGLAQILKGLADLSVLQGLVRQLRAFFQADIHVNAFVTPAGARPHPVYMANDDMFVLQVEGEEVWRLHETSVLQLNLPQRENFDFPEEWRHRADAPVLAEIKLRPGDLLYIPRGMPHAIASPDGDCLDLRIYVAPLSWVDFFKIAAEFAALHSQELRKALPPGFVHSDAIGEGMRGTFEQLMASFQQVPFDRVLAAARRNRVRFQGPIPASDAPEAPETVTVDSEVEHRPDLLCTVEEVLDASNRKRSVLFFGDRHVSGPPGLLRALKFVRGHARFRVGEIPGLDAKGQVILARRLVAEGLLRLRRS